MTYFRLSVIIVLSILVLSIGAVCFGFWFHPILGITFGTVALVEFYLCVRAIIEANRISRALAHGGKK